MASDFDPSMHTNLVQSARLGFLTDTAYAIAIARPAGTLAARRSEKARLDSAEGDSGDSV